MRNNMNPIFISFISSWVMYVHHLYSTCNVFTCGASALKQIGGPVHFTLPNLGIFLFNLFSLSNVNNLFFWPGEIRLEWVHIFLCTYFSIIVLSQCCNTTIDKHPYIIQVLYLPYLKICKLLSLNSNRIFLVALNIFYCTREQEPKANCCPDCSTVR